MEKDTNKVSCWACNKEVPRASAVILGEGKNEFHFCSDDCEDMYVYFSVGQNY